MVTIGCGKGSFRVAMGPLVSAGTSAPYKPYIIDHVS